MNIDAVHQKIADDEALPKAEAFGEAVSDALFAYTCAAESVEDCSRSLDPQGNEEAVALLSEVSESAAQSLCAIDDALRVYNDAFRKLADFARPLETRDIHGMAALDALYALGGSAPIRDVIQRVNDRLAAAEESAWAGTVARACAKAIEEGMMFVGPNRWTWTLSAKGGELAEQRAQREGD